jgi:protein Tex
VGELVGAGASLVRDAPELDGELGPLTRADVVSALERAGQDSRPPFVAFALRDDVRGIEDLKPGMICPGLVTNVTSFGVFVDVGARQDGLVHVSQLAPARATPAKPALSPGDRVEVRVLKVDLEKKQISLSMKPRPERRPAAVRKPRERERPEPRPSAERPRPPVGRRPAAEKRPDRPRTRPPGTQPPVDRPPAERPPGRERPKAPPGRASGATPPAARKPEPRRPAFNNPFAVLAGLKKDKD